MSEVPAGAGEQAIAQTRAWLEHAVIGLNLCPFAKAVVAKRQVRFVASAATEWEALREDFCAELALLAEADPAEIDTTLLVCTSALAEFDDYNDFLDVAEDALEVLGFDGVIQIASFHPHYRFAGTEASDIGNATNRSPWPVLQLLREASIDRVLEPIEAPEAIYEANLRTLEKLGSAGWAEVATQWESAPRG